MTKTKKPKKWETAIKDPLLRKHVKLYRMIFGNEAAEQLRIRFGMPNEH